MLKDKIVVYTSGTFDMLHYNHIKMIEYAKALGDILIVGVNTDELVVSYKAEPVVPFEERMALMKALRAPDIVIPQKSLDHTDKVKKLKFDVFVVGDDWTGEFDYLEELGITVFYFPYGDGVSSSNLKERIHQNYQELRSKAVGHLDPETSS